MFSRIALSLTAWFLMFSSSIVVLNAQFSSSIEGTVTDQSGAVLPKATLTLVNQDTGIRSGVNASEAGYYRFPALAAARFTLTITAPGFRTVTMSDLRLEVGERRTVNINLEVSAQETSVTVTATQAAVELAEARVSGVIATKDVTDLPIVGRNFLNLVSLTPGVTGAPPGLGSSSSQSGNDVFNADPNVSLNASGNRSEQNGFAVDSGTTTSMVRHGVVNLQPNAESIQEVRITVNNFSAEHGSDAGALVNALTKQGTNAFHGSFAYWHSSNALQAPNVFQRSVPEFQRNEEAGSFGGPIFRNRTFFFGSFDVLRAAETPGATVTVETPAFANLVAQRFPANKSAFLVQKFPTSVVPTQNFRTAGMLRNVDCAGLASPSTAISTPMGDVPCNMAITGEGVNGFSTPRKGHQWNARVDHMLSGSDRLYGNVYRNVLKTTGTQTRPEFAWEFPRWNWYVNLNETHTFSPNVVNEFGANLTRIHGEIYCAHCEIPVINMTGMSGFGVGGPTPFIQNNYFYRDVVTWVTGAHTVKGGVQFSALQSDWLPTASYQRPTFSFNNIFDFVLDTPFSEGNIGFNPIDGSVYTPDVAERQKVIAVFAEDSWRVRPNLMMQYGLRWETYGKVGQDTLGNNVEWRTGNDFFSRIADGKNVTTKNILQKADLNNFAPRISFAYDPQGQGRMSLRGGTGVFYDVIPSQLYGGAHYTPPIYVLTTASPQTAPMLPLYTFGESGANPYNFQRPRGLEGAIGLDERNGSSFARANIVWIDPELKNSYTLNYFGGVQYALTSTLTVEANYTGNQGRKLYAKYNVNRFAGDLIQNNGVLRRLNPSFGAIDYAQSNLSSSYNGGNISVRQRMQRGLMFQAAYTFGKATDYASGFGGNLPIVDITNVELNRGPADHDVRQRLSASAVWQLPAIGSSPLVRSLIGGWQLSTVVTLQTGRPFTVFCGDPFGPVRNGQGVIVGNSGCDYNADGHNYDRPDIPAASVTTDDRSNSDYLTGLFTRSDFPVPGLGQNGTLGRNAFRGPGYANVDLALTRSVRLQYGSGRSTSVQFRAEAFNVFNRVNLGQPEGNLASPSFGRSTSAYPGRGIQLGMRMEF
jgi:opacity protein-like surface antigen